MSEHLTFSITLRPEPEGGYTVRVPALPEIVTFGENEAEALAMAKDAIELVLQSRRERGEPVPQRDSTIVRSVDVTAAV
jgi:predicted RNase H-like HicB family nuclease